MRDYPLDPLRAISKSFCSPSGRIFDIALGIETVSLRHRERELGNNRLALFASHAKNGLCLAHHFFGHVARRMKQIMDAQLTQCLPRLGGHRSTRLRGQAGTLNSETSVVERFGQNTETLRDLGLTDSLRQWGSARVTSTHEQQQTFRQVAGKPYEAHPLTRNQARKTQEQQCDHDDSGAGELGSAYLIMTKQYR